MATSTSTTTVVLIGDLTVQVPAGTPHTLNYATMDPVIRQHCRMLLARQPHWVTETELFQDSNYGFYPKSWTLAQISADFAARFHVIQGADLLHVAQRAAAAVATTTASTPATPTPTPTPTPTSTPASTAPAEAMVSSSSTSMRSTTSTLFNEPAPLSNSGHSTMPAKPMEAHHVLMILSPQTIEQPHSTTSVKVAKTQKRRGGFVGKVKRFFSRWTGRARVGASP